jgi:GNAT superfamily N-acetyltransferase
MAFQIFLVPHDDEAARAWQHRVKEFRLLALKTAPDAFTSTYEREAAFGDNVWYQRLMNPQSSSFLAIQDSRIVGSLTLMGPLPYLAEDHSPRGIPWNPPASSTSTPEDIPVSHWRTNGMFVLPEARRQGTAKALIERSIEFGHEQAALSGKGFVGSVGVDRDNHAARKLYEHAGYVTISSEPDPDAPRNVLLMKYVSGTGR